MAGQTQAGVGQTTTGGVGQTTTGARGVSETFGMASRRQTGPFDVGWPDGRDKHTLGFDADGHAINSMHLSTKTLFIGDAVNTGRIVNLSDSEMCPGGDAPLEFDCWRQPDEGLYPVPVRLGYDPNSQHQWCGGPRPGLWRWWGMCNYYVSGSQGTRSGSVYGSGAPEVRPRRAGSTRESYVATVVQTASPVNLGRPNLIRPGYADLRSHTSPDRRTIKAQDLFTPMTYRMEAYGAQGGACSGSILGNNDGYAGTWIPGETWNYTELPGQGRFAGGTASGGVVLMPPEVDMADIDSDLAPSGVTKSTTFMIAAPGARFGAGLPNLANGAMDEGYSWFVDSGKLVFNRHVGTCAGLGVRSFELDTSGDAILGTGEGGIVAATGKTFRAPDITTGGVGNIVGANLTIACGIGTGDGNISLINFDLPAVAASGDNIQTRANRLAFDMGTVDASTLSMVSQQAIKLVTITGNIILDPAPSNNVVVNPFSQDCDFIINDDVAAQFTVDAVLRTTTIAGDTFIPKTASVGALVIGSVTLTAANNDAVDVTDISSVEIDTSGGNVAFGGTVNAVVGQILHVCVCDATNNATMEDNEGTAQDFQMHAGADETMTAEFGGWMFRFNGTKWFDLSHAKHV